MWYCPSVPAMAFTERTLQSLKPLPRTVEYYDTKTSGLSVRVLPTGKKTFYLVHRLASPSAASTDRRVVRRQVGPLSRGGPGDRPRTRQDETRGHRRPR